MSEWKEYKLEDICDVTSSRRIFLNEYVTEGVPFYRSKEIIEKAKGNDISTELFITKERYNEIKSKNHVPVENDILITSVGTLGVSYKLSKEDFFYFKDGNLTWLRNYSKNIIPNYLLYWLRSSIAKNKISEISIGSTQPAITIQALKGLTLKLPDLSTQTAIAEILSSLDDKIELNNKINQELENLAQLLFKRWFVDFEFPNENGEPYKSSGGEMVDSELGELPKGWEVKKLSEIISITGGGTPSRKEQGYWGGDIKWFSIQDIPKQTDILVVDTKEKITIEGLKNSSTKLLKAGTTIITARGTVGQLALVATPMAMNQSCYGVNGIEGIGVYFNFLNLSNLAPSLRANTHGAVFDTITTSTFDVVKTLLPDKMTLNSFEALLVPLFTFLENNIIEKNWLTSLRDTLLPKLISGELEVATTQNLP